eukprot:COSAG06_NODE_4571_length_4136_cov_2.422591_3_plen_123_part_00
MRIHTFKSGCSVRLVETVFLISLSLTNGVSAPAISPTYRPYPDLRSNVLKLFADFQVVIVVLVGLVLRIEPNAFADEAASQAFYGDAMLVLMLLTLVPVAIALLYRFRSRAFCNAPAGGCAC